MRSGYVIRAAHPSGTVRGTDIATKHDLAELETRLDGKLDRLETRLTQRFVTWLLLSQAAVIAAVGALLAVM